MKTAICIALFATPLMAQRVSVGVKTGVPMDRVGQSDVAHTDVSKPRWLIGATAEVSVGSHFSIGVDALYRQIGYRFSRSVGSALFFETSDTNHWEFPAYAKYRFGKGEIRPFATGGVATELASVSGKGGCTGDPQLCGSTGIASGSNTSWGYGYMMGGGVEIPWHRITLAPEFRYTRWMRGYMAGAGSDQPALMLGVRF